MTKGTRLIVAAPLTLSRVQFERLAGTRPDGPMKFHLTLLGYLHHNCKYPLENPRQRFGNG
jgi:hypothetical protein